MSLYFIRHGQTDLNKTNKYNGEEDEPLNEVGLSQAKNASKNLIGTKIDLIYCSPLTRTRQTLACLNLDPKIPVIYDERLKERCYGALVGQDIVHDYLYDVLLNRNVDPQVEGLESIDEVFARVHSLIDEIKIQLKNKNVLLVSHGFVGRAVYYYFNPVPESGNIGDDRKSFPQNCEIRKFEFDAKTKSENFSIVQPER